MIPEFVGSETVNTVTYHEGVELRQFTLMFLASIKMPNVQYFRGKLTKKMEHRPKV